MQRPASAPGLPCPCTNPLYGDACRGEHALRVTIRSCPRLRRPRPPEGGTSNYSRPFPTWAEINESNPAWYRCADTTNPSL